MVHTASYWTTRGLPTRGLDMSRTGQLADATGDFEYLVFVLLAASARPRVVQSATCPVCDLSSLRVDQSVTCPVCDLSSLRVDQSAR